MPLNFYLDWRGEQKHLLKQNQRLLMLVLERLEALMALNEEVLAFAERIDAATNNIADDIKAILANPTTALSTEDREKLEGSVAALETLASER